MQGVGIRLLRSSFDPSADSERSYLYWIHHSDLVSVTSDDPFQRAAQTGGPLLKSPAGGLYRLGALTRFSPLLFPSEPQLGNLRCPGPFVDQRPPNDNSLICLVLSYFVLGGWVQGQRNGCICSCWKLRALSFISCYGGRAPNMRCDRSSRLDSSLSSSPMLNIFICRRWVWARKSCEIQACVFQQPGPSLWIIFHDVPPFVLQPEVLSELFGPSLSSCYGVSSLMAQIIVMKIKPPSF